MTPNFGGATARHYRRFRRDVPRLLVEQVARELGFTDADRVIDLGCGTGQITLPVAPFVGAVFAVDPEPAMLAELYERSREESVPNVLTVLGADVDLARIGQAISAPVAAVAVGNALHWMDAARVFRDSAALLRGGGGVVVITQGPPMWLAEQVWARDLRRYLERWLGSAGATCGTGRDALDDRRELLTKCGFGRTQVLEHQVEHDIDADYVLGHLYSALSPDQVREREGFERGLREVLAPHEAAAPLVEHLDITALIGRV